MRAFVAAGCLLLSLTAATAAEGDDLSAPSDEFASAGSISKWTFFKIPAAAIIRCCLQRQPEKRFQTASELAAALSRVAAVPAAATQAYTETVVLHAPTLEPATRPPITPTAATPPVPTPEPARAVPQPGAPLPNQRALIADDDPLTRYIVGNILTKNCIAFDEAENGAIAVRHLKQARYTLVFLDLMMPRVDGWGVIDFVRKMATPPRLAIVTGSHHQRLSAADSLIVSDVLHKPIDPGEVERVVNETAQKNLVG